MLPLEPFKQFYMIPKISVDKIKLLILSCRNKTANFSYLNFPLRKALIHLFGSGPGLFNLQIGYKKILDSNKGCFRLVPKLVDKTLSHNKILFYVCGIKWPLFFSIHITMFVQRCDGSDLRAAASYLADLGSSPAWFL